MSLFALDLFSLFFLFLGSVLVWSSTPYVCCVCGVFFVILWSCTEVVFGWWGLVLVLFFVGGVLVVLTYISSYQVSWGSRFGWVNVLVFFFLFSLFFWSGGWSGDGVLFVFFGIFPFFGILIFLFILLVLVSFFFSSLGFTVRGV